LEVVRSWRPPQRRLQRRAYEDHLGHALASYLALRRGHEEVAHAWHAPDALAATRWSRRTGGPAVFTFTGVPDRQFLAARRLRVQTMLRACRDAAAVVAVSERAAQAFGRWLGVEARVIRPGVDLARFAPAADRTDEPTIACVAPGDLRNEDVELLVRALSLVRRERPDTRLVLQRPCKPSPVYGLSDKDGRIELLDRDPALLAPALSAAWVSVTTLHSEGLGLALVESLACGTPVVGDTMGASRELIGDAPVGRTFLEREPASVARALIEGLDLGRDAATRAACRARAGHFSLERCVSRYEQLYLELLAPA
jgi:glycosyltransferase involved in cell wall biosynthesis